MADERLVEKVKDIIADIFSVLPEDLKEESTIESFGGDSCDDIELVVELEEAFGIEIEDAIAKDFKTVADVVRCVEEKISAKRGGL
jgi:acyl carrier protein